MRKLLLCFLPAMVAGLVAASSPTPRAKPSKIAITTHLDQTAIWVGDSLRYSVRAMHDKNVEFILENLKKENLNLAPFVVRDITVRQGPFGAGKNFLEVTLFLSTYESGKPELRIPSFSLYYFTHEPGLEKRAEAQAESIAVPVTRVGLRSTLAGDIFRLRDSKRFPEIGVQQWLIPLILGLSGMMFLGLQAGKRVWAFVRTARPKRRRLSARARERMTQDFLQNMRKLGTESAEDQLRFYAEISHFLRSYLGEWLEIEANSLTPEEIRGALAKSGKDGSSSDPIKAILEKCDRVLYAKDGYQLGQKWRAEIQQELEKLIGHRV